ncbi:RELT-like protein 2 [Salminus brasiliensis]|uniref:RELT-like protein 2 n=1 Tax=Salminus brasiliensis TaxID=930266 RepID=UPI003B8305A6
MTDQETGSPFIIFILVFCFFLMGLLGFIICHMLKKKGYRCRTGEPEAEDCKNKFGTYNDDEDNEDTVEQILKCIIENEANMEAFSEMLGNQTPSAHHNLRLLRKESLWGILPHHHTIHVGSVQNFCSHCGQGHFKKTQCRNHMGRSKDRPGEQTVFSVGRFCVTHMEKKSLPDSTNLTISELRDLSDHMEPLDCKTGFKDSPLPIKEGYNIRNMFKGTEVTNAIVPHLSKQKKSDSVLGFGRGSDAVVTKENQSTAEKDNQHETSGYLFPTASEDCLGLDQGPKNDLQ